MSRALRPDVPAGRAVRPQAGIGEAPGGSLPQAPVLSNGQALRPILAGEPGRLSDRVDRPGPPALDRPPDKATTAWRSSSRTTPWRPRAEPERARRGASGLQPGVASSKR